MQLLFLFIKHYALFPLLSFLQPSASGDLSSASQGLDTDPDRQNVGSDQNPNHSVRVLKECFVKH